MQAKNVTLFGGLYDCGVMKTGRPAKYPRSPFGERLYVAREVLGFSQAQVAEKLGITQTAYAVWERYPVALRPDQIEKLADILKMSVEELFGKTNGRRSGGPVGKARRLFEQVSRLPRSQQQHILTVLEAFVEKKASSS